MNQQEQALIENLGAKLAQAPSPVIDTEANTLIQQVMTHVPHAAYMLFQTALIQDIAYQQLSAQLEKLKAENTALKQTAEQPKPASFLGGLLDKISGTTPNSQTSPVAPNPVQAAPAAAPRPRPAGFPAGPAAASAGASTPSFLQAAATTAMGVAGGALLFEGVRHLFQGSNSIPGSNYAAAPDTMANAPVDTFSSQDYNQTSNDSPNATSSAIPDQTTDDGYGDDDTDSYGDDSYSDDSDSYGDDF